ncbi:MAG TPA: heme iron utilization protein [Cyanobacteria bacterium UBA11369]|nr:heme iron utilization protein [Cyanobacteria bacterium UBA11371]HBE35848.1 heme iron utilization protein [Cyanobacteria bacterium UBA11368]HBE53072.1 heme iron utilization protein [Cyanobacteria bacterium UBA11369]
MSEQFSAQVSDRICAHMNEDHADAVLLYTKAFSKFTDATAAQMLSIDSKGMDLNAQANGEAVTVRIEFDHVLKDAEDAHHTLIEMVKQARQQAKM